MAEEAAVAFIDGRFLHKGKEYDSKATEEVVHVHNFDGPVARIRRGYGLTMKLGNYEFARFDVMLELPCHVEDIDTADEFARQWVEKRCEAEVQEVRGGKGGAKPTF
jgi:hypothetical protein